jgi:hypothetical protein
MKQKALAVYLSYNVSYYRNNNRNQLLFRSIFDGSVIPMPGGLLYDHIRFDGSSCR